MNFWDLHPRLLHAVASRLGNVASPETWDLRDGSGDTANKLCPQRHLINLAVQIGLT
jgi:hypothetical protein